MKEKLVFGLVACVLALVAGAVAKFAPEAVGPVAIPLVGVVVVIAAYLKPPAGGGGAAALVLLASMALTSTACDALRPKSPLDFAKAGCIAANAFLDVKSLRLVCDGLDGVSDDDLKALLASHRVGASKMGAAACGDAGAK